MAGDDCIFCKMAAGEVPVTKIFEDDAVLAFLDIAPLSDGHTLLIPKQHCRSVHECPSDVLAAVASRLGEVARAVAVAMNAQGYNVLSNNGRAAGQVVEHLHFHIIPRHIGDGLLGSWPAGGYEEGRIDEIAAKIKKNL